MKSMYNYLGWAAMLSVPLAPAFFFGFEFFKDVYSQIYAWTPNVLVATIPSLIIGLVSAAGLEFVGILSGHNAIRFWERKELNQAVICAIILVSYVALGIVGLENIWTKGVVMFLVAPLVYVLIGMQGQLDKVELKESGRESEDRQDERELKRLRLQLAHEEKMAKIQASTKPAQSVIEPALILHEPAQSQHECGSCGKAFGSVQGLNAHKRFCVGIVPIEPEHTNGVQKTSIG